MALIDKTFSEVIAFTRPASAPYVNSSGQTVTAGVNVPRLTHTTSGQPLGLLLESERQERAVIRNGNWRTPHRGTWVVRGDFDGSIILSGLGFYVEADGEGTIVITYSLSGSKVFSQGRLQYESAMRPTEDFNILDEERAVIARMEFIPAMLGDNEAAAMALGSVDVQPPLAALWAGGHKGFLWPSLPYYQDPAGTTVASWGDPVGLISDDSGNGSDFTQATVTARPVLGRVPVGGRRNITPNSEVRSGGWVFAVNTGRVPAASVDPDGYIADRISLTGGTSHQLEIFLSAPLPQGSVVTVSVYVYYEVMPSGYAFQIAYYDGGTQVTGAGGSVGVTPDMVGVWTRLEIQHTIPATAVTGPRIRLNGHSLGAEGTQYLFSQPQVEVSPVRTPYQATFSNYDVTERGVESIRYIHLDGIDDSVSTTLSAITNGTVVIAGTNGIWIDDQYNHAGGAFSIGPTTYTGGPAGILGAVGDLIVGGSFVIDRQLTAEERTRVIDKLKSMGAPGVFELGPELVIDQTFSNPPIWTNQDELWILDSGTAYKPITASNSLLSHPSAPIITGDPYICSAEVLRFSTSGTALIAVANSSSGGNLTSVGTNRMVRYGGITANRIGVFATTGKEIELTNLSVRKLELIP